MSESSSEKPEIRVGDRQRNAAMERLGNHFADGYLDVDEFSKRTEAAASAKTRSELDKLFFDLPAEVSSENSPNTPPNTPPSPQRLSPEQELQNLLKKGHQLNIIDTVAAVICIISMGLMIFTELDGAWVGFIIATGVVLIGRAVLKINDDDEELLNEINEEESKRRTERLRLAAEKRRQIQEGRS
ncbi:MAG: DUF1707 domain-containing protein [Corynebacterium sp.]|uniref:DUF1707 SHOCT-like domain-containing protein n=1 Tax=Corynebacterium sp. TaxID=1720 RepID=UPI0026DD540B|nr:DUF1707 domain-containing protein [Corynebacterium sp.]MDO5029974.1 DUF1707 domain-containing protein [Corynebacterium sp.]